LLISGIYSIKYINYIQYYVEVKTHADLFFQGDKAATVAGMTDVKVGDAVIKMANEIE
jgi:hypothetical protein